MVHVYLEHPCVNDDAVVQVFSKNTADEWQFSACTLRKMGAESLKGTINPKSVVVTIR